MQLGLLQLSELKPVVRGKTGVDEDSSSSNAYFICKCDNQVLEVDNNQVLFTKHETEWITSQASRHDMSTNESQRCREQSKLLNSFLDLS